MFGLPMWIWVLLIVFGSYGMMYWQSLNAKPSNAKDATNTSQIKKEKEKFTSEGESSKGDISEGESSEGESSEGNKEKQDPAKEGMQHTDPTSYKDRIFVIRSYRAFLDRMPTDEEITKYAGKPGFLHSLAETHGLKELSAELSVAKSLHVQV